MGSKHPASGGANRSHRRWLLAAPLLGLFRAAGGARTVLKEAGTLCANRSPPGGLRPPHGPRLREDGPAVTPSSRQRRGRAPGVPSSPAPAAEAAVPRRSSFPGGPGRKAAGRGGALRTLRHAGEDGGHAASSAARARARCPGCGRGRRQPQAPCQGLAGLRAPRAGRVRCPGLGPACGAPGTGGGCRAAPLALQRGACSAQGGCSPAPGERPGAPGGLRRGAGCATGPGSGARPGLASRLGVTRAQIPR